MDYRVITNLVDNIDSSYVSKVGYIYKVKNGSFMSRTLITSGKAHNLMKRGRTKSILEKNLF